jgi:hypothetical protein
MVTTLPGETCPFEDEPPSGPLGLPGVDGVVGADVVGLGVVGRGVVDGPVDDGPDDDGGVVGTGVVDGGAVVGALLPGGVVPGVGVVVGGLVGGGVRTASQSASLGRTREPMTIGDCGPAAVVTATAMSTDVPQSTSAPSSSTVCPGSRDAWSPAGAPS